MYHVAMKSICATVVSNKDYIFQKCVCIVLGIQHAMCMLHLSGSTIFFTLSHQWHNF